MKNTNTSNEELYKCMDPFRQYRDLKMVNQVLTSTKKAIGKGYEIEVMHAVSKSLIDIAAFMKAKAELSENSKAWRNATSVKKASLVAPSLIAAFDAYKEAYEKVQFI